MGLLRNGEWFDQWYDTKESGGEFRRQQSRFRSWITENGEVGPSGSGGFAAEPGRYHLYVSLACPWAHRTLIFRKLKQLEHYIDVTVVNPLMLENGWELHDPLHGFQYLYQLYLQADPGYAGRVTVPVLWDKQKATIVNNESSEIIRMFNSAFNGSAGNNLDFYPRALRGEIDEVNRLVYDKINNGVYRAGFATSQNAYEKAYEELFDALDWVESRLTGQRYLAGDKITEADWRLFTTLLRFDAVYYSHFKCNKRRMVDYPALSGYLRELYQYPGVADTVNFRHIKCHYYGSHKTLNPTGIVPLGPELNLMAPHQRDAI